MGVTGLGFRDNAGSTLDVAERKPAIRAPKPCLLSDTTMPRLHLTCPGGEAHAFAATSHEL